MTAPAADPALVDWAVEAMLEAGRRTLSWFRSDALSVDAKGDGTPVTEADRDAERFLRRELAAAHPDDAIVGEEEGTTAGSSTRRWVIDPIDGTKAFMRGVPLYSSLLAMEDEHGWALGVINLPAAGECVFAGRGLGAFQIDRDGARVPARVAASTSTPFLSSSGFSQWDDGALLRVKQAGWTLRTWGDGFGYAMVATGRIEAMVDPDVSLWDIAPMPIILTEAGGRFSSLSGSPSAELGSAVATNGDGHDELLALLQPSGN